MVHINASTYQEAVHKASSFFPNRLDIVERLLCDRLNWTKTDFLMNANNDMKLVERLQFQDDLSQLIAGKPLQYIVGKEWFYGRCFMVNEHTLIPRPETEQLVEKVLTLMPVEQCHKVLDIGTGSGVIGITVKLERPNSHVTMVDISTEALKVAKQNATMLNADVTLVHSDLCQQIYGKFDCIISNPPYIAMEEVSIMDKSVLQYEPHLALFAENNGLAIYERLAKDLPNYLSESGVILLEIGYKQASKVKALFQQAFPTKTITILQDYANLDRMLLIQ